MSVTIGILIGGLSARMGRPKALIEVNGDTLLERTVAMAASVVDRVVLLGTPHFELPRSVHSVQLLPDLHPQIGPIGGLESLLSATVGPCILLACDMPRLPSELLNRLKDDSTSADAVVCATGDSPRQWHPCCALYRPTILPRVQAAISARRYGMIRLLSELSIRPLDLGNDEAAWVENWNDPSDMRAHVDIGRTEN